MARIALWKSIADDLKSDIAKGHYSLGGKLPTEAVLATKFGVNRHTVRHAISALSDQGLVHARRGSGVFVTQEPTDYQIGRRVRYHQNLMAAGRSPTKRRLVLETRVGNLRETEALALPEGSRVHVYEGLSLADTRPIALFRSIFPADHFPELCDFLTITNSVTQALKLHGVADYTRKSTRVTAKLATPTQALHLKIRAQDPILRTVGINIDPTGDPVEYGHSWFAGDKVSLVFDAPKHFDSAAKDRLMTP